MTNPECRDCHLKNLEWGETKDGKPMLYEVRRIPHFAVCKAKKNGPARGKQLIAVAKPTAERALAIAGLMALKFKALEAAELLRDIPEGEPTDMVLAALKRKGA